MELAPTDVKLATVVTTVTPADKAPDVRTRTAIALAMPEVTDTVDAPSSKSAVEYLPRLNLT